LDTYTILQEKGTVDGLNIALVGDMNMRVMHALPLALSHYDTQLFFISPQDRSMPSNWLELYNEAGLQYTEHETLDELLPDLDVIYLMGTLTPSYALGKTETGAEKVGTPEAYVVNADKLSRAKDDLIVLHPLPRTDELPTEVDALGAARYFEQARYGVSLRMALLSLIFGRTI
jgi:aspartate carbamoyltransferase catalytic subunit